MPEWKALPLTKPVGGGDLWMRTDVAKSRILDEARTRRTREHNRVQEIVAVMPVGYLYRADIYCAGCILFEIGGTVARKPLVYGLLRDWARAQKINIDDERSYDSGEFPKAIYRSEIDREKFPYRCGRCLCHFGMDPNQVGWCERCGDFWAKCRCR